MKTKNHHDWYEVFTYRCRHLGELLRKEHHEWFIANAEFLEAEYLKLCLLIGEIVKAFESEDCSIVTRQAIINQLKKIRDERPWLNTDKWGQH